MGAVKYHVYIQNKLLEIGYRLHREDDLNDYYVHPIDGIPNIRIGHISKTLNTCNEFGKTEKRVRDVDAFFQKYSRVVKLKQLIK